MEAQAKRLATLVQLITILTLLSIAGEIRHIDATEVRNDALALTALKPIQAINVESAIAERHTFDELWLWMQANDATANQRRLEVRRAATKWLTSKFQPEQLELEKLAGKGRSGRPGKPFFTEEMRLREGVSASTSPDTVDTMLRRLRHWRQPLEVRMLPGWPPATIPGPPFGWDGAAIGDIRVHGESLTISSDGRVDQVEQSETPAPWVIPAATIPLKNPPRLWDLLPLQPQVEGTLATLDEDSLRRDRLSRKYGPLTIDSANAIVQQELGLAYKNADLFGVDVSAQHATVALWLVLLAINVSLVLTLKNVRRSGVTLVTTDLESVFAVVLSSRGARFGAWVLAPAIALYVGSLDRQSGALQMVILAVEIATVSALGFVAWWQSRTAIATIRPQPQPHPQQIALPASSANLAGGGASGPGGG